MFLNKKPFIWLLVLAIFFTLPLQPTYAFLSASPASLQSQTYTFLRSWGGEGNNVFDPGGIALSPDEKLIYVANRGLITVINRDERTFSIWDRQDIGGGQLSSAGAIAVDSSGNIYVTDSENHCIVMFSSQGQYLKKWGSYGSGNGQFDFPFDIAINSKGHIFVADRSNNRVQKFTSEGAFLMTWGSYGTGAGAFSFPVGIAIDPNDNVYVNDSLNYRIQKFTSEGVFLKQWGSRGSGDGQFAYSSDVAADRLGNIYVVDSWNYSVQKFSYEGVFLARWGKEGDADSEFRWPVGIVADAKGNITVTDNDNHNIKRFDASGKFLYRWGIKDPVNSTSYIPDAISMDGNGDLYLLDYQFQNERVGKFTAYGSFIKQWGNTPREFDFLFSPGWMDIDNQDNIYVVQSFVSYPKYPIRKYDIDGGLVDFIGRFGDGPDLFSENCSQPGGIAINGYIYAVDTCNHRIMKLTLEGSVIMSFGSYGKADGQFVTPRAVAVDQNGNVYIADTGNYRIQKFDQDGKFIKKWGGEGSGAGQIGYDMGGIAIDSNSNVFVADTKNHRVQKFNSDGIYLTEWGGYGTRPGQMIRPTNLFVDSAGLVYVTNTGNYRVDVYTSSTVPLDQVSDLLVNGKLEDPSPLNAWTYGGSLPVQASSYSIEANRSMSLGLRVDPKSQGEGEGWAFQTLYIPQTWDKATLRFKYNIFTNDIIDYSDFTVVVQDGTGLNHIAILLKDGYSPVTPGVPPTAGKELGWKTVKYDMSKYKGQYVRIVFSVRNLWPNSWGIWSYLDDISLQNNNAQTFYLPFIKK